MVRVTVTDADGNEAAQFAPECDESLGTQIQDQGVPLSIACGVGACGTCRGKVVSGAEHIDAEANGPAQYPLDDGEILTCISCVREDAPDDASIEIQVSNL